MYLIYINVRFSSSNSRATLKYEKVLSILARQVVSAEHNQTTTRSLSFQGTSRPRNQFVKNWQTFGRILFLCGTVPKGI